MTVRPAEGPMQSSQPRECRAARRSSTRRQGTLAAPGAAAASRLPQHGESSSTRIWTEAMEVPTTSTPNGHHLPPIADAGPRGPAPNGRTSPPLPSQPSESDRQRFTRTPTRQPTERPARPPPPSQGRGRPVAGGTARRGPAVDQQPAKGVGGQPPPTPPPASGAR